ncbi:MAG: DUF6638 family protein, partial [Candidatus Moraniibacteriota bacterium]
TMLTEFSIDGSGWSPEIAKEKNEMFYLAHGGANQFHIILTPKQNGKTVYYPYYSFSRSLMEEVFQRFSRQVADITEETAVILDIDQNLSHYLNPGDLLFVDSVIIRTSASSGLIKGAQDQRTLVNKFMRKDDSWFDENLRRKIIESAKSFGDLRSRSVIIPSIPVDGICSFWTAAFGGAYVFRDDKCSQDGLLILENDAQFRELQGSVPGAYSLADENLLSVMEEKGLLDVSESFYHKSPEVLERIWECLLIEAQLRKCPTIFFGSLNPNQKKSLAAGLKDGLPPEFFQIERFMIQFDKEPKRAIKDLPPELRRLLIHPKAKLKPTVQAIIWQLLSELNPLDVVQLYAYNKKRFFQDYPNWLESKKDWAVNVIKEAYEPQPQVKND